MSDNGAPPAPASFESSSTGGGATLPSGSRLTLEGIKSLAEAIKEQTSGEPNEMANEIVREVDELIAQVIIREAQIYQWVYEE